MKRIIYYILLITSIMCLQVRYAVAGSNVELTSDGNGWFVEKTNHGGAAKNLSNKLNQKVIATDGVVRIYSDGGVLGFTNGQVIPFVECQPGNKQVPLTTQPRGPANQNLEYVDMGGSTEMVTFLANFTLQATKDAITGLTLGDQQLFLADYKTAPATTFTLFNTAESGPKMVAAWVEIKSDVTNRKKVDVLQNVADILLYEPSSPVDVTELVEITNSRYVPGSKGSWNKELNNVTQSNATYLFTFYGNTNASYTVDGQGRVITVKLAELKEQNADRNVYQ